MYAKVQNDQVVGIFRTLPRTYANISGFDTLTNEDRIKHGFYPLVEVKPTLNTLVISSTTDDGGNISETTITTQRYGDSSDSVEASQVTRTYSVVNKLSDEINSEVEAIFTKALETLYDKEAKDHRYDSRLTCALRAGYVGPFQAEGVAFATWMDNCNAYAYGVMGDVLAATRTIPTIEELISELPELTWPT